MKANIFMEDREMSFRKFILCSNMDYGFNAYLGMDGPIYPPRVLPAGRVYQMVTNGMVVFEHNPENPKEKIRLTKENFNDESKFTVKKEQKPPMFNGQPLVYDETKNETADQRLSEIIKNAAANDASENTVEGDPEGEANNATEQPSIEADQTQTQHLTKAQRKALRRQQRLENAEAKPSDPTESESDVNTSEEASSENA